MALSSNKRPSKDIDTSFRSLCSTCQRIDFDALRGPSASDIEALNSGGVEKALLAPPRAATVLEKVELGTLGRIRSDALHCPLCALLLQIITRQGAVYLRSGRYDTLDSEEIRFRANPDTSYFAKIRGTAKGSSGYHCPRRLSLTAHHVTSPDNPIAYFDHAIQFCGVGALHVKDFAAKPSPSPSIMPFGGRKRPTMVDMELIERWLEICTTQHRSHCSLNPTDINDSHMNCFRLIDVERNSIREIRDVTVGNLDFVALSYMWGGAQTVKLLKANKSHFQVPGALQRVPLPRTIAQSIGLARQLGFQYIWVDAFCIVQDDPEDQVYQVGKMANIFSSACLTILATSGQDCNAGLPGFGPSPRRYEQQEVVVIPPSASKGGMSVMNTLKSHPRHWDQWYRPGGDVDMSKWRHRAWTMQEKALSRRCLMFTDEQIFWTCRRAHFSEESCFEVPNTSLTHFTPTVHEVSIAELVDPGTDPWELYDNLVYNYMQRDLTYEGDIHAAFQAIAMAMTKSAGTSFHWGLPVSHFELALLWETFHGVSPRRAKSTLPMTNLKKQVAFPSWSWMGWKGSVNCNVTQHRRESESTTVVCFIHLNNPLRFVHVSSITGETSDETRHPIQPPPNRIMHNVVNEEVVRNSFPSLTRDILSQYPDGHLLFFWAETATFRISYLESNRAVTNFNDYALQMRPSVVDRDGTGIGHTCKVPFRGQGNQETNVDHSEFDGFDAGAGGTNEAYEAGDNDDEQEQEFVAIGRRQVQLPGMTEDEAAVICPPMVLALQVSRAEYNIVTRKNVSEIRMDAWMRAGAKRRLLVLA